jgi:ATP-dependent exoDNAse (exonuclease V) beta subunit
MSDEKKPSHLSLIHDRAKVDRARDALEILETIAAHEPAVAPKGPTPEQKEVIESWGQGIAVMAGAGSGKTFTLVAKVRALLERSPEARFAAVSFTEKSASDLRAKLTKLTLEVLGKPLQGQVVTTIHGLCSSILREYPREAGYDGDEVMLSETEASSLWYQALDALFFEELAPEIEAAFAPLAERESRESLYELLARARDLKASGILDKLGNAPELRVLAAWVLERYDRLKRRRGALDFNDLELGADRALQEEHVSADYRKRFELVMVDEFQDTNPVQARILTRFARPDFSNLCVVGDPKQSIYRFRDADVSVFEEFCSRMPKRLALTKNFRSVPGILEFCNQVCAPAFEASGMKYEALAAGLPENPKFPPVVTAEIEGPEDLARLIRAEMAKDVPLSDMALLLRKIRGRPEKWLKALTAAGIPIAVESGGLLWNDPRARELAHFLRWWANPSNEISGVAFLRAPWVGVPEREIDEWRKLDPSMMHSFLRSNHRLARLLRPLRYGVGKVRPGELLLALMSLPEIEEELGSTALALWHRAEEGSEEGLDFSRVAERIFEACDESRRERAVPPPKNAGQLRVMTVHGAKGLEFPHVILIDFPGKPEKAKNAPLLFWDRERGAFLAGRNEKGKRLDDDPAEQEWRTLEKTKELAEAKRVFYVALTRAQQRLMLVLPAVREKEPEADPKKAARKKPPPDPVTVDFWRGWMEPALSGRPKLSFEGAAATGAPPAPERAASFRDVPAPPFPPRRPRHSVSEWNLLSRCERSYEWTTIRKIAPTEEEEWQEMIALEERRAEKDKDARRAPKIPQTEVGTRVHRCLELRDEAGLRELEELVGKKVFDADSVIEWMRRSPLMAEEGVGRSWKELAFEVPVEGETLIGALDRLVLRRGERGNEYVLVDFKVTARAKSEEDLLDAYRTQLNLYAWALGRMVPEARNNVRAFLVHIAGGQVKEIEVELEHDQLSGFRERAGEIVRGRAGAPSPGSFCEVCDHRERCEEGKAFVARSSDDPSSKR